MVSRAALRRPRPDELAGSDNVVYYPSRTAARFHASPARVRQLVGPFGSGKSVTCAIELLRLGYAQAPGPDGWRRTRYAIIRNTYAELRDTTYKTFCDWVPAHMRTYRASEFLVTVTDPQARMESEFLFRALDRPEDVRKLLSMELSGAWLNENREIPRAVHDMIQGRITRYPRMAMGGVTHPALIGDTNPFDTDHYLYKLFVEQQLPNHELFHQPGGRTPRAENLENLEPGYYTNLAVGKNDDWIKVYIDGEYGYVQEGKPVYPEWQHSIHVAHKPIPANPDLPLIIGLDFGLTPAAAIFQQTVMGQWRMIDELVTDDMGASRFSKALGRLLRRRYPNYQTEFTGDPAGDTRADTDEQTPFMVLAANDIEAVPAATNDFTLRRDAVANNLLRLGMDGQPGLIVSPTCKVAVKGMSGRYQYKRMQVPGDERYHDKPDKNIWSHVCEAMQYALVGAGEDARVLGGDNEDWAEPDNYDWDEDVI